MPEEEIKLGQKNIGTIIIILIVGFFIFKTVSSNSKSEERVNQAFQGKLDQSALSVEEQSEYILMILSSSEAKRELGLEKISSLKKDAFNYKDLGKFVRARDFIMGFWKKEKSIQGSLK